MVILPLNQRSTGWHFSPILTRIVVVVVLIVRKPISVSWTQKMTLHAWSRILLRRLWLLGDSSLCIYHVLHRWGEVIELLLVSNLRGILLLLFLLHELIYYFLR